MSSKDAKVAGAGIKKVCSGRKWKASRELEVAEEQLHKRLLLRAVAKGHASLGFFPTICMYTRTIFISLERDGFKFSRLPNISGHQIHQYLHYGLKVKMSA